MEKAMRIREGVEEAKRRCEAVEETIPSLRISPPWKATLLRLVRSELSFLRRLSLSTTNTNLSLSVNVGHLESVIHILQHPSVTGVSRVCKPISLSSPEKKTIQPAETIYVDIVCCFDGRPVWFIVSDRNPSHISWSGPQAGDRGLKTRIHSVVKAARSSEILKPSSVILFFSHGLDGIVHEKLREEFAASDIGLDFPLFPFAFSEDPEDGWINIFARSYHEACVLEIEIIPSTAKVAATSTNEIEAFLANDKPAKELSQALNDSFCALISGLKFCSPDTGVSQLENLPNRQLVNFDTTALVAIVSGISNGGIAKFLATPENLLRERFKGNYVFVIAQVDSETLAPVIVELTRFLYGKGGIVCERVCSEFEDLVSMYGGPNEKFRANQLLKCLKAVPDSPSSRIMSLPTTRKLDLKNKVVFGTGDHWHAPTLTANSAFIRAVSQTGLALFTIEHRPRALIGD